MQRRRLMDLGVVPGTEIAVEMRSATGDPTAYLIRGASIALRKKQASQIQIERQEERAS
jgi:Fe2+ transport system protein FeoA